MTVLALLVEGKEEREIGGNRRGREGDMRGGWGGGGKE